MSSLQPPSNIERIAGSVATEGALTVVSVLAGSPLAALLPVLGKSLAAERQKARVEAALRDIDQVLAEHESALKALTDAQYKLINESILALLQTTAEEKMVYLRRVVRNTLTMSALDSQEAVVLSRVVRDMSADEARFLCETFSYDRVQVALTAGPHDSRVLNIRPATSEALVVTGLVSLGLLEAAEPTWDDSGLLRYSSVTAKLIALLRDAP